MKTCPYCGSPLENNASRCQECGHVYWLPDRPQPSGDAEQDSDEEMPGCLPVLFWPLALSVLVSASLIFFGFVIHVLSRLTDFRLKAVWIICSLAAGGAVFFLVSRLKRKKS
jgi:hypothetical protein